MIFKPTYQYAFDNEYTCTFYLTKSQYFPPFVIGDSATE